MLQIFKIYGDSLYPLYKSGQRVVCRKIFENTKINVDDTVVFEKRDYGTMIKRVKYVQDDAYYVEGTNPYSIDSRDFGMLSQKELKFKVLFKF